MIKLTKLISEIKKMSGGELKFVPTSYNEGRMYVYLGYIHYEIREDKGYKYLDVDVAGSNYFWEKYAESMTINAAGNDEYSPEIESARECEFLMRLYGNKLPGTTIEVDSYDVSYLRIPLETVMGKYIKSNFKDNFPKYIGNDTYEYNGRKIKFQHDGFSDRVNGLAKYKIVDLDSGKVLKEEFFDYGSAGIQTLEGSAFINNLFGVE